MPANGLKTSSLEKARECLGSLALAGALCGASAAEAASLDLGGLLHIDYGWHDEDRRQLGDGFLVRRARVGVEGELDASWAYELEADFAENDVSATDMWFRYTGWAAGPVTLGQFKVPFGLNELESSNAITFIERSLPNTAFAPSRRLAIGFRSEGEPWLFQTAAFGQEIGADVRQSDGDEGLGVAVRLVFSPVLEGHQLHFGVAGTVEEPASSVLEEARFRTHPEARPAEVRLVDTGTISGVELLNRLGLEAAWRSGPVSVQGEWMQVALKRDGQRSDPRLQGHALSASWILTGESRRYGSGRFQGVEPQSPGGAWELGVRYSSIDLNSGSITGGEQQDLTLGLNWYLNPQIRFMANLIQVESEREAVSDDPLILLLRGQISF